MTRAILVRCIVDIIMYVAILVFPWWISAILIIVCITYLPLYLEGLYFAFIFDTLYANNAEMQPIVLLSVAIVLAVAAYVRTRIRV